jgi:hypothetical protein
MALTQCWAAAIACVQLSRTRQLQRAEGKWRERQHCHSSPSRWCVGSCAILLTPPRVRFPYFQMFLEAKSFTNASDLA